MERQLADRAFALLEMVLRLGVTRQCRCYDPLAVTRRLKPIIELARLIDSTWDGDQTHDENR